MNCPTCDHTMHALGGVPTAGCEPTNWCPRCGTISTFDAGLGTLFTEAPKLVERCRIFERDVLVEGKATVEAVSLWYRLGMTESINLPADRPA